MQLTFGEEIFNQIILYPLNALHFKVILQYYKYSKYIDLLYS